MITVIGVRFRTAGKIYFFDPQKLNIRKGQHVIVETARGVEYGTVVVGCKEVDDHKVIQPLKAVIRVANTGGRCRWKQRTRRKRRDAFKICLEKIAKHGSGNEADRCGVYV